MSEPSEIVLCTLFDEYSGGRSIGLGLDEESATEDAIAHFIEKPRKVIQRRIDKAEAELHFERRQVRQKENQ